MTVTTWKRSVLNVCGGWITDSYRPPAGLLLPSGHTVGDRAPLHVRHILKIPSLTKFKADLEFLLRHYQPLELSELEKIGHWHPTKEPARQFVLSFDDGMREVHDVIAPFLREKGVPAIFFLNSVTIDNKQLMWRHKVSLLIAKAQQEPARIPPQLERYPGKSACAKLLSLRFVDAAILDEVAAFFEVDFDEYLRSHQPYMTTQQVLELARGGFEFGSHSASHPCFNEISVEDQKKEIFESVQFIQSLGLACRCFAFPFHDRGVPLCVFNYMRQIGIALSFGSSDARVDSVPFSLQRFALDAENTDFPIPDLLDQLAAKSLALRLSRTELIRRN
jgi:peptidoglycan/xylan/chitin deacetylase (PgdA/CDA1 family)